jgi:hypothetical protein
MPAKRPLVGHFVHFFALFFQKMETSTRPSNGELQRRFKQEMPSIAQFSNPAIEGAPASSGA